MCLCVSAGIQTCIRTCIYTYTHLCRYNLISYIFHKNKSFKAYIPTNSLYSCALHWTAKYLRDLILLGVHIVCVCFVYMYSCMYVCIYTYMHTHTHTHHIHRSEFYLLRGYDKRRKTSLLSHQWGVGETGMSERKQKDGEMRRLVEACLSGRF